MTEEVEKKIKSGLISTGIFLEKDTYQVFNEAIADCGFVTQREYSYSYGKDPTVDGSVDILASTVITKRLALMLSIECKKADPKLKYWVFEPHRPAVEEDAPSFLNLLHGNENYDRIYELPNLGYGSYEDYENAVNVFEFNKDTGKMSGSNDKAQKAFYGIRQANEALPGIIEKELFPIAAKDMQTFILPLVVTTANLWVTRYEPKDIRTEAGDIDEANLGLERRDWVMYYYPTRASEAINGRIPSFNGGPVRRYRPPAKMPTFVVNAVALPDFLPRLIADLRER